MREAVAAAEQPAVAPRIRRDADVEPRARGGGDPAVRQRDVADGDPHLRALSGGDRVAGEVDGADRQRHRPRRMEMRVRLAGPRDRALRRVRAAADQQPAAEIDEDVAVLAQRVADHDRVGLVVAVGRELRPVRIAMTTGVFVSSSILFGSTIVVCALGEVDLRAVGPVRRLLARVGLAVPAEGVPPALDRRLLDERPHRLRPPVRTVTVTVSFLRNLTLMCAWLLAQLQTGQNALETSVPETGLFSSFSFSVMAKAAAVAMSRPSTVAVERIRCKAGDCTRAALHATAYGSVRRLARGGGRASHARRPYTAARTRAPRGRRRGSSSTSERSGASARSASGSCRGRRGARCPGPSR